MQILVNFKIEGKCIRQSLPDTTSRVLLSRFLLSMTHRPAYSGMQMKCVSDEFRAAYVTSLIAFPKIGKNTRGRLELLTSIYAVDLKISRHFRTKIKAR